MEQLSSQERCPECGYPKDAGHSPLCSHYSPTPEMQEEPAFCYEIMTNPEQRMLLAKRVDELVEQVANKETESGHGYDAMIFLDKSARPVVTLFLSLWQKHFGDEPYPPIRFLNIGSEIPLSEFLFPKGEMEEHDYKDMTLEELIARTKTLTPTQIHQLFRNSNLERLAHEFENLLEKSENPNLLMVDEFARSGKTEILAKKILHTIVPKAEIESFVLAREGDVLFSKEDELNDPPWHFKQDHDNYGISGTVDPESPTSLLAQSTPKGLLRHRQREALAKLDKFKRNWEKPQEGEHYLTSLTMAIEDLGEIPGYLDQQVKLLYEDRNLQSTLPEKVKWHCQDYIEKKIAPPAYKILHALYPAFGYVQEQVNRKEGIDWEHPTLQRLEDALKGWKSFSDSITLEDIDTYIQEAPVIIDRVQLGEATSYIWKVIASLDKEINNHRALPWILNNYKEEKEKYKQAIEFASKAPYFGTQVNHLRQEMKEIANDYWETRQESEIP